MATTRETQERYEGNGGEPVAAQERPAGRDRPVVSLVRELLEESGALVSAEVALAKTELRENISTAQRAVASMVTGGVVLLIGAIWLVGAAIFALALVWPTWLAALVVGGVVALIGAIMLSVGRSRMKKQELRPERTLRELRDTRKFVRDEGARARENLR